MEPPTRVPLLMLPVPWFPSRARRVAHRPRRE